MSMVEIYLWIICLFRSLLYSEKYGIIVNYAIINIWWDDEHDTCMMKITIRVLDLYLWCSHIVVFLLRVFITVHRFQKGLASPPKVSRTLKFFIFLILRKLWILLFLKFYFCHWVGVRVVTRMEWPKNFGWTDLWTSTFSLKKLKDCKTNIIKLVY